MSGAHKTVIKGNPSQYVKLNIGGSLHYTTIGTLTKHDTMLTAMFSGRMEVLTDSEGWILIDRCGKHFGTILNFLRDGSTPLPEGAGAIAELLAEAKYYCIADLAEFCEKVLAQKGREAEPICRVPLITSHKEEQLLITNSVKPVVKLLINRHNNKYSYTTTSDDNLLKNIELFDRLSLRFSERVFFIKNVIGSSEICCWSFYGHGKKVAEVCCTSIVYATDKKHTKVDFPEARIYEETLNILLYENRTGPDQELMQATSTRGAVTAVTAYTSDEEEERGLKAGCKFLTQNHKKGFLLRKCEPFTSGIIVTGDEVLKGQVLDTNSYFLCKRLYEMGIKVVAVSKVADDIDIIASEVKKFSRKYDYVLTTGGVGPTHDDVTYEAVGKAFNDKLFYHPELTELVMNFYKIRDTNHPALKMAYVPTTSKLTYGFDSATKKKTLYPNVSVKNVFMFPGVPQLCERIFNLAHDRLFKSGGKFHARNLYLTENEVKIVGALNETVEKYPDVLFGSYPKFFHSYYDVKISLESSDESKVDGAFAYLKQAIPKEFQTEYDENPFLNKSYKIAQMRDSILVGTLNELREFLKGRSPDSVFLYFDGGKNSTVLLYILSLLYEELFPNSTVNGIYVEKNPKINRFIETSVKNHNLNLLRLSERNFVSFAKSSSRIIVVKGTRLTDPNASRILNYFESLPVHNPLSEWTYGDVWKIIRGLFLPYCELYDQGYTSICEKDALPNSHLIMTGPRKDFTYYKKAHELQDFTLENSH